MSILGVDNPSVKRIHRKRDKTKQSLDARLSVEPLQVGDKYKGYKRPETTVGQSTERCQSLPAGTAIRGSRANIARRPRLRLASASGKASFTWNDALPG